MSSCPRTWPQAETIPRPATEAVAGRRTAPGRTCNGTGCREKAVRTGSTSRPARDRSHRARRGASSGEYRTLGNARSARNGAGKAAASAAPARISSIERSPGRKFARSAYGESAAPSLRNKCTFAPGSDHSCSSICGTGTTGVTIGRPSFFTRIKSLCSTESPCTVRGSTI